MVIRDALSQKTPCCVSILNYKKGGKDVFWNVLSLRPVFNPDGALTNFIGNIMTLPVPPGIDEPKLCLDVAVMWMRQLSAIPGSLKEKERAGVHQPSLWTHLRADTGDGSEGRHGAFTEVLEDIADKISDTLSSASATTSATTSPEVSETECETPYETGTETTTGTTTAEGTAGSGRLGGGGRLGRARFGVGGSAPPSPTASMGHGNVEFIAETSLPTKKGRFRLRAYRDPVGGGEPIALVTGDVAAIRGAVDFPIRVHDQCMTSEVLGSLRCDCKNQLDYALEYMQNSVPAGMVIYLPQEGRGIGLANKVAAYALQESGFDTVDANRELGLPDDARCYDAVPQILKDIGVKSVRLMTNNPRKISCLEELGVSVTGRIACVAEAADLGAEAQTYLGAKVARMGHLINAEEQESAGIGGMVGGHRHDRCTHGAATGNAHGEAQEGEAKAGAAAETSPDPSPDSSPTVDESAVPVVFATMEEAVRTIREGGSVVVMDDESRENEGDLIMSAELATAPQVAFFIRHSTGILCAPMTADRAALLDLPRMVEKNGDPNGTAFTVTTDAVGTTTGVSAVDRCLTLHVLADPSKGSGDIQRPGHVFPLVSRPGGVVERRGHTEASTDLCLLAGLKPCALIAELTNDDGALAERWRKEEVGGEGGGGGRLYLICYTCMAGGESLETVELTRTVISPSLSSSPYHSPSFSPLSSPPPSSGTMKRLDDCASFARRYGLPLITVDAMVEYIESHGRDGIPSVVSD
jgi:GTP cyclohydrolase II/3,4-dihydroxy-2-butanone 4-phosphate synthase